MGYETNVRLHLIPRIGKKRLARLAVRDVRLLVDGMRADGHRSRVVQHSHATLRAALEHAYREEIVPRDVAKPVRVERPAPVRPREPLTADEAVHLLKEVKGERLAALWTLLVMLGLRRSEACGLRWEQVDFEAGTLRIIQTVQRVDGTLQELPTKTRRSNRTVPLPARCRYALAEQHHRLQEANGAGVGSRGTRRATSSALHGAHRWNRETSPDRGNGSASACKSARCRSMRCATRASACCSLSGCIPGS